MHNGRGEPLEKGRIGGNAGLPGAGGDGSRLCGGRGCVAGVVPEFSWNEATGGPPPSRRLTALRAHEGNSRAGFWVSIQAELRSRPTRNSPRCGRGAAFTPLRCPTSRAGRLQRTVRTSKRRKRRAPQRDRSFPAFSIRSSGSVDILKCKKKCACGSCGRGEPPGRRRSCRTDLD